VFKKSLILVVIFWLVAVDLAFGRAQPFYSVAGLKRPERRSLRQRRSRVRAKRQRSRRVKKRQAANSIPTERVIEIQEALIKAGYLEGPPSGQYDGATQEAMRRFQADSGLPATGKPSAHSLSKLGVSKRSDDGYAIPIRRAAEKQSPR
jgi:peptidoglycan hydrolase-like protein with peptidoglycan-binding domain